MELLNEIRNSFAQLKNNKAIKIGCVARPYRAWVLRHDNWYGVAIPYENADVISERFSNVHLWSKTMMIEGYEEQLLLLTSDAEELRNEFATVCAQFCDTGHDGNERNSLSADPYAWWEKWKDLLGNSVYNKLSYSVLGEMIVYEQVIKRGMIAEWSALKKSTHDIENEDESFEVKSTIKRYESTVTINSQYQLKKTDKDLSLIFCRFEPSLQGVNINDVVERLVNIGVNRNQIDDGLEKLGYELGCNARKERYILHEIRQYIIDEKFPQINAASFVEKKLPDLIIKLIYEVDLNGLEYSTWQLL